MWNCSGEQRQPVPRLRLRAGRVGRAGRTSTAKTQGRPANSRTSDRFKPGVSTGFWPHVDQWFDRFGTCSSVRRLADVWAAWGLNRRNDRRGNHWGNLGPKLIYVGTFVEGELTCDRVSNVEDL